MLLMNCSSSDRCLCQVEAWEEDRTGRRTDLEEADLGEVTLEERELLLGRGPLTKNEAHHNLLDGRSASGVEEVVHQASFDVLGWTERA